jgi:hypothetical protein
MPDCAFDPSAKSGMDLSNGDLTAEPTTSLAWGTVLSVLSVTSGKYYVEVYVDSENNGLMLFGVGNEDTDENTPCGNSPDSWAYYVGGLNPYKRTDSSNESYGSNCTTGDYMQMAFDADSGKIWWGKNDAWNGDPEAGTGEAFTVSGSEWWVMLSLYEYSGLTQCTVALDSGDWNYSAPSGFGSICPVVGADGISFGDTAVGDTQDRKITDDVTLSDLFEAEGGTSFATVPENLTINDLVSLSQEMQVSLATDDFIISDGIDAYVFPGRLADVISFNDSIIGSFEYLVTVSDGFSFDDETVAINWSEWVRNNENKAIKRYLFTLTGSPDSKEDVEIPISSFQGRKRTGYDTYMSITIPGISYASDIADRPNGEMVLCLAYEIDGQIELQEEFLRVDLTKVTDYQGSRSRNIVLQGYKRYSYANARITLYDPIYKSIDGGRILYRFSKIDPFINPSDTCVVDTDEFTVDYVNYYVTTSISQMEVRET